MKSYVAKLLTFFMLFSLLHVTNVQEALANESDYEWNVFPWMGTDTITITKYKGVSKDVYIPETLDGKSVRVVGQNAFKEKGLTSVTIPEGVDVIGEDAFFKNELTKVVLPNSVRLIHHRAFQGNKLTSLTIPENVTTIGLDAFANNQLSKVNFHNGMTSIVGFKGNQLTEVVIPENVTNIGSNAFVRNQLTEVTIPKSVTSIGNFAFAENKLTKVTFLVGVETIGVNAFAFNHLTEVNIPDSVTSIGGAAFTDNKLSKVTIPKSVTNIGMDAFSSNQDDPKDLTIFGYKGSAAEDYAQEYGHTFKNFLEMDYDWEDNGDGSATITDYKGTSKEVVIPDQLGGLTVTHIGEKALSYKDLTSVTIPESVISIGNKAFEENWMTEVIIPESVTNIGDNAFAGNNITKVTILNDAVNIGINIFISKKVGDSSDITINGNADSTAEKYAMDNGHTFLKIIEWTENGDGTVTITKYNGTSKEVVIPDQLGGKTVTKIGEDAFAKKQLTKVTIPESVENIGKGAFWENSLTSITIPGSVTSIGDFAFYKNFLTSVSLSHGVQSIGYYAFHQNSFASITIPESVTSIGDYAFDSGALSSVYILSESINFGGKNVFIKTNVGNTGVTIYGYAGSTIENYAKDNNYNFVPSYKVIYGGNGNTGGSVPDKNIYGEGDTVTVSGNTGNLVKTGHTFTGWNTYADGSGMDYVANDTFKMGSTNVTLFAQWMALPSPPSHVTATAGNNRVSLEWEPVNGATGYKIFMSTTAGHYDYHSPEGTVSGSVYSYEATSLINGTNYYFVIRAINESGDSADSQEVSARPKSKSDSPPPKNDDDDDDSSPSPSPSGGSGSTSSSAEVNPAERGVDVLVNGRVEKAGSAATVEANGRLVTTVTVHADQLQERLDNEHDGLVLTIPIQNNSDVMIGELNGQMVKNMEHKQAILEIKTEQATYTLPAEQINIDALAEQIGQNIALQDIKVQVEIAIPTEDTVQIVANSAEQGGWTIVAPPLNFTVRATYEAQTVEVTKFDAYVERMVAIPEGVDPNQITTGVVVEPDGTVRHVPTKIAIIDGKYYAVINSLSNSTYTVVWNPLQFSDVVNHWAKEAVNDMGSRMVVNGMDNGLFQPDQDITRAEFAAILVRGLGINPETGLIPFRDVQESDWYYSYVQTAYEYQLIRGFEDGTFRPRDNITREQAIAMIARAMSITGLKSNVSFSDVEEVLRPFVDAGKLSSWAKTNIAVSLQAGIISGKSEQKLAPQDNITRAEVAVIVQKLLQKSDLI